MVTIEEREAILQWLDYKTSGELIFDNRPYVSYTVRPTKKISFKDYLQEEMGERFYSGTFTISFTAFDPFGKLTQDFVDDPVVNQRLEAETGVIDENKMPEQQSIGDSSCLVYNPGTELGHSIIIFSGNTGSENFEIYNSTTGDKLVLKAGLEMSDDEHYEISSKTGRILRINGNDETIEFLFHDEGYITFAPYGKIWKNIEINTTAGDRKIMSPTGAFNKNMIGKYVYISGAWKYIGEVISVNEAILNVECESTETTMTDIVTMNYLTIKQAADASINRLEIKCIPEVR